MNTTEKRASMPKSASSVLDRRTVNNANRNLLEIVKEGDSVLDVGCGTGAITSGIAKLVGETGSVHGIDSSEHLIEQAKSNFSHINNLSFELVDLFSFKAPQKYDVITSARVLQWLEKPEEALLKMKALLKEGGCVTILDYNHSKIEWDPEIPESMRLFYDAFLKWRKDAGMDNEIADNLPKMLEKAGLKDISITDQSEISEKGSQEYEEEVNIWNKVAESRGKQLVAENYITESQRLTAIEDYTNWINNNGQSMKLYLKAVTGFK